MQLEHMIPDSGNVPERSESFDVQPVHVLSDQPFEYRAVHACCDGSVRCVGHRVSDKWVSKIRAEPERNKHRVIATGSHANLSRVPISFSKGRGRMRMVNNQKVIVACLKATPFSPLATSSWYYSLSRLATVDDQDSQGVPISA